MGVPAGPDDVDPAGHETKPWLSTMWAPTDPVWNDVVHVHPARRLTWRDLRGFERVLRGKQGLILRGSVSRTDRYRDLFLALYIKLSRFPSRRPAVLITDATWEPRSRALEGGSSWRAAVVPAMVRTMIRLLDGPHVTYAVLSTDEVRTFPTTWGVDPGRVVFTPFCHTLRAVGDIPEPTDHGHLFAGGNSLRDYDLLARALRELPGVETRVAARWRVPVDLSGVHASTTSPEVFVELMASSAACVTPLERSVRSAGQQTYLNAMALGKPVVVTDSPGVRDYIEHGVTGWIVDDQDPADMATTLRHVLDPAHREEVQAVARRASEYVLGNHSEDDYRQHLLEAVSAAAARRPTRK